MTTPRFPIAVLLALLTTGQDAAAQDAATPSSSSPAPIVIGSRTGRWFAEIEKSIEAGEAATSAVGLFAFQNPTDAAIEWRTLTGSCTCSSTKVRVADRLYEMKPKPKELVQILASADGEQRVPVTAIPIGPHEQGEVEVHVEMQRQIGSKVVTLDVHSTDPGEPMIRLKLNAMGKRAILVEPAEIDLGNVPPGETRTFDIKVTSPVQPDFEVKSGGKLPPGLEVTLTKAMQDKTATWTIHGTLVARANNSGGGSLDFTTTIPYAKMFSVRVAAKIQVPVEATPGFVSFGQVKKGSVVTRQVRLHANDGSQIEATAVHIEKLSIPEQFVSTRLQQDGKDVLVDLVIAGDAPGGLVRGNLAVELSHAAVKRVEVLFNGFVR